MVQLGWEIQLASCHSPMRSSLCPSLHPSLHLHSSSATVKQHIDSQQSGIHMHIIVLAALKARMSYQLAIGFNCEQLVAIGTLKF